MQNISICNKCQGMKWLDDNKQGGEGCREGWSDGVNAASLFRFVHVLTVTKVSYLPPPHLDTNALSTPGEVPVSMLFIIVK
jgi:hypothetical protein